MALNLDGAPAPELHITIWPSDWADFCGSADALKAEGLVPDDVVWPARGQHAHWQRDGLSYFLRPARGGYVLRIRVASRGPDCVRRLELDRRAAELRRDRWLALTAEGRREAQRMLQRTLTAWQDPAWQRFKAKVPGLGCRTTAGGRHA